MAIRSAKYTAFRGWLAASTAKWRALPWGASGGVIPTGVPVALLDDALWSVTCGDDTIGWRDVTDEAGDLVYTTVRPGGAGSCSFTVPGDSAAVGYNELQPDRKLRVSYAGERVWSGIILPRPVSYEGTVDGRPPLRVEATGLLARAKRRADYCHVFTDLDLTQWYTAEIEGLSPGIQLDRQGHLKFAAASGSVFGAYSQQQLWYHLHGGLSTEQVIHSVAITWLSSGVMEWILWETDLPIAGAYWNNLGGDGGSTHATPETVLKTCSAGMRGLALEVVYPSGRTLTADEWVRFTEVRIYGQSGNSSIGAALSSILVGTGLAGSYYSKTVP